MLVKPRSGFRKFLIVRHVTMAFHRRFTTWSHCIHPGPVRRKTVRVARRDAEWYGGVNQSREGGGSRAQSRWVRWVTTRINPGELQLGSIQVSRVSYSWAQSRWVTAGLNPGESGELQLGLIQVSRVSYSWAQSRWVTAGLNPGELQLGLIQVSYS